MLSHILAVAPAVGVDVRDDVMGDFPQSRRRILAIDHIQLAMPAGQEHAARRFYGELLGLTEVPKPPHLASRGGLWFEQPNLKLHLGIDPDFRPARKAHPGLLIADLAALVEALREAGHDVVDGEPLEGYEHVYVSDPFGNRLELLEPL